MEPIHINKLNKFETDVGTCPRHYSDLIKGRVPPDAVLIKNSNKTLLFQLEHLETEEFHKTNQRE